MDSNRAVVKFGAQLGDLSMWAERDDGVLF
jgi:hypothetical protein